MSTPLSQVPQTRLQPIGAFNLASGKEIKAGHFVVNPPIIRPYTFYDKIKVDPDFYNELINPKSKAFYHKPTVKKQRVKGILKAAALIGAIVLAATYRRNISKFLTSIFTSIKNIIKK